MIEACVLIGLAVIIVILRDIRDYLGTISEILGAVDNKLD